MRRFLGGSGPGPGGPGGQGGQGGSQISVERIMASINFTRRHMEQAISILSESRFDRLVELIDKNELIADPMAAYTEKIYAKGAPLKTAVIWSR